jgi:4-hydroxybenzoate polyprenyltransferase
VALIARSETSVTFGRVRAEGALLGRRRASSGPPTLAPVVAAPEAGPGARRPGAVALAALRPRQWTKNLLVFAGLLFASKLDDPSRWIEATGAFVAFCALSSAAYVVNDIHDAAADRLHPRKRLRPIASGELTSARASVVALALVVGGIVVGATLGIGAFALLGVFALLQLTYTYALKHVAFLDVLAIACAFVIRAAAGAEAVHVRISPWLLTCTALLALFLALAKRRAELVLVGADRTPGRAALRGYSPRTVSLLLWLSVAAAAGAYVAYASRAHDSVELVATIPFVLLGLGRYLHLIYRQELGEEPEHVLASDPVLLGCVALWAATAAVILGGS